MSLSRVRPGDAESNPLVLDARGHLVQQCNVPTRPARRIIHEGPPSTINPHVRHKRRVAVSVVVHSPLDEIATRDAEGRRRSTRDMVAEMHAQEARAHSPGEGPSRLAVTVDEAPSSPEVTITGFRAVRVNAPSSPEITITGYRPLRAPSCQPPLPRLVPSATRSFASVRARAYRRLLRPTTCGSRMSAPRTTTSSRPTTYAESVMGSSPTLCRTGVATATVMYASEPHRHWGEEAGLRAAYPGWDVNTKVKGTWKGLKFPSA
ncbi:hypothetical protein B0H13DRAFT_2349143 [Mycena leptocephala]|nr:hypothetical protein B0H13DRAFT_2349143 [Mycena leptocephala]